MKNIRLIGILGKKQSGKDTVASYLVKKYEFKKRAMADPLKLALKEWFYFSDDQLNGKSKEIVDERWGCSPRKAMQFIGTELVRNNMHKLLPDDHGDFWIKNFCLFYNSTREKIVVPDIRFPNEIEMIKNLGGKIIGVDRKFWNEDRHLSENSVNLCDADFILCNSSSIEDLHVEVDKIMNLPLTI
jgi:hypothetical protein